MVQNILGTSPAQGRHNTFRNLGLCVGDRISQRGASTKTLIDALSPRYVYARLHASPTTCRHKSKRTHRIYHGSHSCGRTANNSAANFPSVRIDLALGGGLQVSACVISSSLMLLRQLTTNVRKAVASGVWQSEKLAMKRSIDA